MADFLPYASEEEKRKAEAKSVLERQQLAGTRAESQARHAAKLEERMAAEKERQKNERIANAMGLSVQEKAAYLKANQPPVVEEPTIPGGGETAKVKEVKLAPTPPAAPSPQGGVGTKPTGTKPPTSGSESQATTTQAIAGTAKLADKVAASKSGTTSKPTLDELTGYLDNVAKDVNNDPRFNNTNIERDLLAARADAYKMYKEKADRNQLLGTVERAINAIAQFASAQAGFGTRQAGGNLPLSSADYGGQTAQAFKEYETEVGLIGEEQKAGERASDRKELLKEKEIGRRQKTILERIETERNALREAAAEKRARIAEGGSAKAEARRETRDIRTGKLADVKDRASNLSKQIEATQSAIKLGNRIGTGKSQDQDKEVAEFASAINKLPEDLQAEMDVGGKTLNPLTWGNPSTRERSKQVLSTYMKGLQQDLVRLRQEQSAVQAEASSLRQGLGLSTTPVPAGQAAASSGMVDMIDPKGRPLRVPENKVAELEAAGATRK
jgi:hypothetical protein